MSKTECEACAGDGYEDCDKCDGTGQIECKDCDGTGEIGDDGDDD